MRERQVEINNANGGTVSSSEVLREVPIESNDHSPLPTRHVDDLVIGQVAETESVKRHDVEIQLVRKKFSNPRGKIRVKEKPRHCGLKSVGFSARPLSCSKLERRFDVCDSQLGVVLNDLFGRQSSFHEFDDEVDRHACTANHRLS
jgi:hypothetical protein